MLVVTGQSLVDGKNVQLAVHNTDDKAGKFDPNPELAAEVKGFKQGDYVKAEVDAKANETWVKKIEAYKMAPGEEQPHGFVFNESYTSKEGDQDVVVVRLIKFGHVVEALVPMKKTDAKTTAPDPVLAERAGKFKKDDVVEAELQPGGGSKMVLVSLDAYAPPEHAKMVKVGETEVDGQKYPTAELDQDGKTVSLPIVGKTQGKKLVADGRVLGAAKALKPGAEVLFRTREEGGKTYLKEIQAAPKAPAAKAEKPEMKPDPKAEKPKGK